VHRKEGFILEDFDIIFNIMQSKNVNQKQLADCLGVSEQKISDWKAGRIKSWLKHIDKIAGCLGVTVGECLGVAAHKKKPTDKLSELKESIFDIMEDLSPSELQKLLEYTELLEAARRSKANM
jgi:transcriptional regulator with XRE-family HTH domain